MSLGELHRFMGNPPDHNGMSCRVLVGGSVLVAAVLLATGVRAEPVAFPGAEGYGANASGGRGGIVLHVTTTNDAGPGSFREALTNPAARTIVFDVGGTIDLQSFIKVKYGNVTIAGQTAPGGIQIHGNLLEFNSCSNIVIRHINLRGVHNNPSAGTDDMDLLNFYGRYAPMRSIIVDHVSFAGGEDESVSGNHATDVTIQWCSMAYGFVRGQGGTWHSEPDHNYGSLWGYQDLGGISFHHNLMGNFTTRFPTVKAGTSTDLRNNVLYNWADVCTVLSKEFDATYPSRMNVNMVGNYYREGLDCINRKSILLLNSDVDDYTIYFSGNKYESYGGTVITGDDTMWNDNYLVKGRTGETNLVRVTSAIEMPPVTTYPVNEAYTQVMACAGAYPFDCTRRQLSAQIQTKTGKGKLPVGPYEWFPYNANGATRAAMDTDRDGMPDLWERAHGLNPNNAADRNIIVATGASPGDRYRDYTYLEYYIGEVADNLVPTPVNTYTINVTSVGDQGQAPSGLVVSVVGGWTPEWNRTNLPTVTAWGTQQVYNAGSIVMMRAHASTNLTVTNSVQAPQKVMAKFSHWSGGPAGVDGSTNPVISFIADANYTLQAVFNASLSFPSVSLVATDPLATEAGPTTGQFTVSRGTNTSGTLIVNYTVGGTASNTADYTALSGNVTISNGMTHATIVVIPIDDVLREGDETVSLTLAGGANYEVGTPFSGLVTLADDEPPLPVVTLSATTPTATERGPSSGVFTFSRGAWTLGDLDIAFAIGGTASNGVDYVALTGMVTIPDGETFVATPVVPVDDTEKEGPETVTLGLIGNEGYKIGTAGDVTVTIGDNDCYTAVTNGLFNAASTWDAGVGYPSARGDWANIAGWTVTASNVGEVAEGVVVNLSAGGVLKLPSTTINTTNTIHSNALVNVNAGGLLWVGTKQICTHSNVVNGGALALPNGSGNPFGGVVTVAGNSVISNSIVGSPQIFLTSAVHGGGTLTLKGMNNAGSDGILLASSTTWTGNWDVANNAQLRFATGTNPQSIPRGIRVGSGATAHYSAALSIKGTLSGAGTNKMYQSSTFMIGSSTNLGVVSPGDVGVNGGIGTLTLTSYSTPNYAPTLAFSSNSVYEVEMTDTSVYDRVTVVGTGTGTGNVTIAAGAVLNVTLWTPTSNTTLDATIIDTAMTNGNNGLLTGSFTTVNWSNTSGWTGLVVTNINNDLRVQGSYTAVANPDANTNGIPDVWETGYFGSTTNAEGAAEADWDKDGLNNYGEYVAGTIPTNGFSTLVFSNLVQSTGAGMILRWSSESNRFYTLRLSTNLLLDPFSTVLTDRIPASPPVNIHTDAVGRSGGAFYRITVTNQ